MEKKEKKDTLTNELLGGKFKSQFELVNYAIRLADNLIRSGRAPRVVKLDTQNPAALILEEIVQGKDVFEIIPEEEVFDQGAYDREHTGPFKSSDRKKTRRLL